MVRIAWAVVSVLLAGLITAVPSGAEAATATDTVRLVEVSSGECHSGACFGYTLRGPAGGEVPGTLSLSIDYAPDQFGPSVTNTIGGTWVLDVSPTDFIFGSISAGTIEWNPGGRVASITADMTIDGGQGAFQGATGTAFFEGRLWNRASDPDRGRGTLILNH